MNACPFRNASGLARIHFAFLFCTCWIVTLSHAEETSPSIHIVDSATQAQKLPLPGDVFFGQTITLEEAHANNSVARIGIWEGGVSKTLLEDYPFTEYVLMISGRVVVTNQDGTSNEFIAGDTFVIPKGFTGVWDIKEHMRKQMVQMGDPNAKPKSTRLSD